MKILGIKREKRKRKVVRSHPSSVRKKGSNPEAKSTIGNSRCVLKFPESPRQGGEETTPGALQPPPSVQKSAVLLSGGGGGVHQAH